MPVERAATPAVEARAVSKRFVLHHNRSASLKVSFLGLLNKSYREVTEEFWALRDISFTIRPGESVGLVGRNGSGKSTLLKLVAGIHRPTSGHLLLPAAARIGTMIELGVGFHPDLSGTENVFLNASIHGLTRPAIEAIYPRVVEYSGLGRFMDVALKNYSSGMHMRLGFAIAANLEPDILLLDEIFAVGDADFQQQCMKTIDTFIAEGRTLLFVSHAASAVQAICRRVCLLDRGDLLFDGPVESGLAEYQRLLAGPAPEHQATPVQDAPVLPPPAGGEPESWALDLLEREGLKPVHQVLAIGLGTPSRSGGLADYVGAANYSHWQYDPAHLPPLPPFDYAIAPSVLPRLSLNATAALIAGVVRGMRPGARLYLSWFEAPDPAVLEPLVRSAGITTFADTAPYHCSFELLAGICDAVGARAARVRVNSHPRGESVLVVVRS